MSSSETRGRVEVFEENWRLEGVLRCGPTMGGMLDGVSLMVICSAGSYGFLSVELGVNGVVSVLVSIPGVEAVLTRNHRPGDELKDRWVIESAQSVVWP